MHSLADLLHSSMLSRQAIGVALITVVVALVMTNRSPLREVASDPAQGWRIVAWASAALGAFTLAWVTVFDDWLQIVVEPYRLSMRWNYQRILFDAIDPAIRAMSYGLLAATVLGVALLVARHISGYAFQVGGLLVAILGWIPVFILNQRLNALVLQGADSDASASELLGLAAFWLVRIVMGVIAIGISFAAATFLTSLVASLLLDIMRAREPRTTQEAEAFFASLQNRAEESPDRPIQSFWRPIERPS